MLERLDQLGINDKTQGFPVKIYTPGMSAGLALPDNLMELLNGPERIVDISFKGTTDDERIEIATDISEFLYYFYKEKEETDQIRLLLVMEEAPSFMPENLDGDAADKAKELRSWITRDSPGIEKIWCFLLFRCSERKRISQRRR